MDIPGIGKVRINKVYEQKKTLIVEVETMYGQKKLSLGLNKKYVDPETGVPSWVREVKKLLIQLYGDDSKVKKDLSGDFDDYIGEIDINDLDNPEKKAKKIK